MRFTFYWLWIERKREERSERKRRRAAGEGGKTNNASVVKGG